ncbi:MAG: PspC domain-containing protein [Oscillospiraceae bacterium]|jgi:phage shock protein C|nr:PspC domain-containing protein [Oscillospiraceae bacterium]
MRKKFYTIKKGKKVCGVCNGLSVYFNIDVTLIRVLWLFLFFTFGFGIIPYIVLAVIFPSKEEENSTPYES